MTTDRRQRLAVTLTAAALLTFVAAPAPEPVRLAFVAALCTAAVALVALEGVAR